jgi:hypothetical protein
LIPLHAPEEESLGILDCAYNNGVMWRKCTYRPAVRAEIDDMYLIDVRAI